MAGIGSAQRRLPGRTGPVFFATLTIVFATLAGVLAVRPARASAAEFDPDKVAFTLEGCRNDGTVSLPRADGRFICPDTRYTTGNLGKGWSELDLVPHRITAVAGTSAPATQTYRVTVALDARSDPNEGYDVLSAPELNASRSSDGCQAPVVGPESIKAPGINGGISATRYRIVTITQARRTTCVYDFYGRLALGAHNFPGSSLHANLANQDLTTAGIGSKEVPIPVKEIAPQQLSKDMSAARDVDHTWNVTKAATPARVRFADSCMRDGASADVAVTVSWERIPAAGNGRATIVTNIYATNPASRSVTVSAVDRIYEGSAQTTLLDESAPSGPVVVPARQTVLVMTHTAGVDSTATTFNDVATATYTDVATGVRVPGNTTAAASATEVTTRQNDTAVITDVEKITGDAGEHLGFAVTSVSNPLLGAFTDGYTLGTRTRGPVTWMSNPQSGSGSVTFHKRISLDGPAITSGVLRDEATLTASNGFKAATAEAGIAIDAGATVGLTIDKTIPDVLTGAETQHFRFHVTDAEGDEVAARTIAFAAGETSKSVTVDGLAPGRYTVAEDRADGWDEQPGRTVDLNLPRCSGTVTFHNVELEGGLRVVKSGPAFAYHGDTVTFSFAVTNTGEAPLSAVKLVDDHCTLGATPASRSNDDGDDLLENPGADGTSPEVWVFTCSYVIGAHAAGEQNPIVNTVTATAKDPLGRTFTATDTHKTTVLHPAVKIGKTGPATAMQGDRVTYTLVVTNPGDTRLVGQTLAVTDPLCEAPPMLQSKGADPSPGTLDPGDAWTYTCTVQSTAAMSSIDNVANVKGNDANGRVVTATARFQTALGERLPGHVDPGAARLIGPAACVKRAFAFTVRGSHIATVVLRIDGRRYRAVRVKGGNGKKVTIRVNPRRYRAGKVHRVTVRVTFDAATGPKPKTLRAVFQRCKPLKIKPNFTG